jgi:hypothetical protein
VEVSDVQEYISLYAEQVEDTCPNDLVDQIVANYSLAEEEAEECIAEPNPPIAHDEALLALHVLRCYEEENAYRNVELLKLLRKQDKEINVRLQESHKQVQLDRWFIRENSGDSSGFGGVE